MIGWIESFLSSRTQRVAVNGYMSQEAPVWSGVPQGTVLGPLFSLILINDIMQIIRTVDSTVLIICMLHHV